MINKNMNLDKNFIENVGYKNIHRLELNYDELSFLSYNYLNYFYEWKYKNIDKFLGIIENKAEEIKQKLVKEFNLNEIDLRIRIFNNNFDITSEGKMYNVTNCIEVYFNFLNTSYCTSLLYVSNDDFGLHNHLEKDLRKILKKLKPNKTFFEKIKKLLTNN